MGRELVIPLQLARAGGEREYGVGVEVVAEPLIAVHRRVWIAGPPEDRVRLGVVGARHPGGPAAAVLGERGSLPRLRPRLARLRDGEETPHSFAGVGLEGGEKAAHADVAARGACHDHVLHHKRRGRAAVVLLVEPLDDVGLPERLSGEAMEGDQPHVIGRGVDAVAQYRHAAVGSLALATAFRLRTLVVPDRSPGPRVERKDLVGARDVHHPVHHDGRQLQHRVVNREDPLELEVLHVGGVDLVEAAVPVTADRAVVGEPVVGVGMKNVVEGRAPG